MKLMISLTLCLRSFGTYGSINICQLVVGRHAKRYGPSFPKILAQSVKNICIFLAVRQLKKRHTRPWSNNITHNVPFDAAVDAIAPLRNPDLPEHLQNSHEPLEAQSYW